jgi:hypothetical protein
VVFRPRRPCLARRWWRILTPEPLRDPHCHVHFGVDPHYAFGGRNWLLQGSSRRCRQVVLTRKSLATLLALVEFLYYAHTTRSPLALGKCQPLRTHVPSVNTIKASSLLPR